MIYHRRNKKKINRKIITIVVVLLVLFFFGSNIKNIVQWSSVPVINIKNGIVYPFKTSIEYFKFKNVLINENEELKNKNKRLEIENLTVESLKGENKSLKEIIGYVEEVDDFNIVKVLNYPPFSPYDTFLIQTDKEKTFVADKVYYSGVIIGEIEEVYKNTSVVRLYSSPDKKIAVKINEQQTEAVGIGGGGFIISLPKDLDINNEDVVFVGDFPIGKVDGIESDIAGAFQNIYFRYPFNINQIDFVEIKKTEQ